MRIPLIVMSVLVVALYGVWLLADEPVETQAGPPAAPVSVIAERVAELRGVEFDELPDPVTVTAEEARAEGLEVLDEQYPEARRLADEDVYELLGLIEPGDDLRELSGDLFGEGVAGYYDPSDGRLRVVEGAGTGNRVLEEMILAHELTHALEDQRFGLPTGMQDTDDQALALDGLHEGSATVLMYEYVDRHFSAEETFGGLLSSAFADTGDLPPFLMSQVLFGYVEGDRFVSDLISRAGGRWDLVDTAFEVRPPSSTEQVLHPAKYLAADEPQPVRIRAGLGAGWERALAGTWGELQTREMLGSAEAAAGWGGDRYELWRRGDERALVMRWRWDRPRDVDEFEARLRERYGDRGAIGRRGGEVTLALADDPAVAERLAGV